MKSLVDVLKNLVKKLSPIAKAVVPTLVALVGAVADAVASGDVNTSSISVAVTGVIAAIVTYLVPNK